MQKNSSNGLINHIEIICGILFFFHNETNTYVFIINNNKRFINMSRYFNSSTVYHVTFTRGLTILHKKNVINFRNFFPFQDIFLKQSIIRITNKCIFRIFQTLSLSSLINQSINHSRCYFLFEFLRSYRVSAAVFQ